MQVKLVRRGGVGQPGRQLSCAGRPLGSTGVAALTEASPDRCCQLAGAGPWPRDAAHAATRMAGPARTGRARWWRWPPAIVAARVADSLVVAYAHRAGEATRPWPASKAGTALEDLEPSSRSCRGRHLILPPPPSPAAAGVQRQVTCTAKKAASFDRSGTKDSRTIAPSRRRVTP
jgi:hypothetical protein